MPSGRRPIRRWRARRISWRKKFIRIWTDYAAHSFGFDSEKDVVNLAALEGGGASGYLPDLPHH